MSTMKHAAYVLAIAILVGSSAAQAAPVGTAFTYQGQLKEGGIPASGEFDLQFRLFDAISGGNQIGSVVQETDLTITNGMFTKRLDFGAGAFNGDGRWLQISVARAFTGNYTVLSPRQALTAAPYAVYASTVPDSLMNWAASGNHIYNTNTANVGIGTTSPGRKLQVGESTVANSEGMIRLESRSGTQGSNRIWDIGVPETDADSSGFGYSFVIDDINLGTDPEFMVKWGSGNVGIGTSAPEAKLHIRGGSGTAPHGGGAIVVGSTTMTNISIDNNEIMARNNGQVATLTLNADGGNVTLLQSGSGGVAIGTSSVPAGAKLNVQGGDAVFGGAIDIGYEIVTRDGFYASCPAGKKVLGGGCMILGDAEIRKSYPLNNGWQCELGDQSGEFAGNSTYAICARVK